MRLFSVAGSNRCMTFAGKGDYLGLDEEAGPYYIEFIAGDPGDNNAGFFFHGAMDVLKPYIDSDKVIVMSDQTGGEDGSADPERGNGECKRQAIYDNVIKIVTTFLCNATVCDINNYRVLLINSGFYAKEDLTGHR